MIQNSGGGPGGGGGDWFHVNGVDYNPDLDQIAFSSRFSSEIYIICLLYTSPSPRDVEESRMPSSA